MSLTKLLEAMLTEVVFFKSGFFFHPELSVVSFLSGLKGWFEKPHLNSVSQHKGKFYFSEA